MGDQVLIRCHCGQLTETVQLEGSIPVDNFLCHCNICRQVTGALTFTGLRLQSPPIEVFKAKLAKYATSENISRYFCETCGSHVCYYVSARDGWAACSGAVDQVTDDKKGKLEVFRAHEFLADTVDGGLVNCIPGPSMYMEDESGEAVSNLPKELKLLQRSRELRKPSDTLQAACRCGRVSFSLARPDESDINSKWRAGLCVCRSCRLSFSQSIVPWALNIPFAKICWSDGTTHDGSPHKSIRRFQSSDHAHRDFCPTCGASVFYYSSKQPGLVDIAFGLLRADDGALARSWFDWDLEKVFYPEDAVDEDLIQIVCKNLKAL